VYQTKDNFAFGTREKSPNTGNDKKQFSKVKPQPPTYHQPQNAQGLEIPNMNIGNFSYKFKTLCLNLKLEIPRQNLSFRDLREDLRLLIHMQNFYMQIVSKQNESIIGSLSKLTNSIDGLR
jgi:hypothetical protein